MGILIKGMDEIPEDGAVLVVRHDNGKAYIKHACTYGYSMELVKLPAIQPVAKDINVLTNDCISRQAALDTIMGQPPEPHYPSWYAAQIEKLPAAQPDHTADSGKKVCVDTISRQAALKKLAVYIHLIDKTMGKGLLTDDDCMEAAKSVLGEDEIPAVQPDRAIIDDCLHHIYKNISVHTATGGVITIKHYMQVLYEEIYGEGEKPWWMT